jgi:endo-1,4-beta-xylanase
MRLRTLGVAVAMVLAVLAAGPAAFAATHAGTSAPAQPTTLRGLAAQVGLRFGTAIIPFDLNTPALNQIAAAQFSVVTPGNEMKWQVVEPTQGVLNFTGGDNLVAFAKANNDLVRGHTLLWHNQLPNWLTTGVANGTISNDQLRALLHQHVIDEVTHFKGEIWQWDVANEFFSNTFDSTPPLPDGINSGDFWVSHLGEGIIGDAFRWAHQADPHAILFYNDFNIAGEDGSNLKSNNVFAWLKTMLAEGVPIQGVGDQGHLDTQFGFPSQMESDLARFASLGLKVAVTEADVRTFVDSPTTQKPTDKIAVFAQANLYEGMLKACLSLRSCISFTVWGFADEDSWVPPVFKGEGAATLWDVNLSPKPAFADLQQDLRLAKDGAPHRTGRGADPDGD